MKVLIGCEFSGVVRDAFIEKGHDAISCDLLPTEREGPHFQGDIYQMLNEDWDLIICHPPCTALAVSGNSTYGECKQGYVKRLESVIWTRKLWDKCKKKSKRVCFENPVGVLNRLGGLPKPNYIQPYMFGHPEQKKTGLILHNLPPLRKTDNVKKQMDLLPLNEQQKMFHMPPSPDRWKLRSTTYPGIAEAMSKQWGHQYFISLKGGSLK